VISPDGRKLLVYNHKKKMIGWFNHREESELIVYSLGYDYKIVSNAFVGSSSKAIPFGSYPGQSAEFTADKRFIYFTRESLFNSVSGSNKALCRWDLRDNVLATIKGNVSGDLRRGKDGRVYIDNEQDTKLPAYITDAYAVHADVTAKDITVGLTLSGAISSQNHKVTEDQSAIAGGDLRRWISRKYYELSDHLGNVTVVFNDRKEAVIATGITNSVLVESYNNYYAFGMKMPNRYVTGSDGYRYGFNGKEKDPEGMGGGGSTYDYGFRIYNPALGRFLSVDPLTKEYPYYTPYQFAGNMPINCIDLDGLEPSPKYMAKLKADAEAKLKVPIALDLSNLQYLKNPNPVNSQGVIKTPTSNIPSSTITPKSIPIKEEAEPRDKLKQFEPSLAYKVEEFIETPPTSNYDAFRKGVYNMFYGMVNDPYVTFTGNTLGGNQVGAIGKQNALVATIGFGVSLYGAALPAKTLNMGQFIKGKSISGTNATPYLLNYNDAVRMRSAATPVIEVTNNAFDVKEGVDISDKQTDPVPQTEIKK
jgi:RHS repeat-associated protein